MPIAEDPEPRPSEGGKDPFADLVLDEEFVRAATTKEQSARTRMLAARWKHTPPVDPGGRRSVNDGPRRAGRSAGRRLDWRTPVIVVLVILLVLVAMNLDALRGGSDDRPADRPSPTAPQAPDPSRPTQPAPQPPAQGDGAVRPV